MAKLYLTLALISVLLLGANSQGTFKYAAFKLDSSFNCTYGAWIVQFTNSCYALRPNVYYKITYSTNNIFQTFYSDDSCKTQNDEVTVGRSESCDSGFFITNTFPFKTSSNLLTKPQDCSGDGTYVSLTYPYSASLGVLDNCVENGTDYSQSNFNCDAQTNLRLYCGSSFIEPTAAPGDTGPTKTDTTDDTTDDTTADTTEDTTQTGGEGNGETKTFPTPTGTIEPPKELNPDQAGTKLNGGAITASSQSRVVSSSVGGGVVSATQVVSSAVTSTTSSVYVPSLTEKGSGFMTTRYSSSGCNSSPYGIKVRRSGTCVNSLSSSIKYICVNGNAYALQYTGTGCSSNDADIYLLRSCSITAVGYASFSCAANFPSTSSSDGIVVQYSQAGCKGDQSWFIAPGVYSNSVCSLPSSECLNNVLFGNYQRKCGGNFNPDVSHALSLIPTLFSLLIAFLIL